MERLIAEIVRKLHSLSKVKVLDFVDFLSISRQNLTSPTSGNDFLQKNEEFEAIADCLADQFQRYVEATTPALSDDAVSRAGMYEKHA